MEEETSDGDGPIVKVEIHEFPLDCVACELSYHFSKPPNSAKCRTPIDEMFNHKSSTFILEFNKQDASQILENPIQYLDEEDSSSMIKLSMLEEHRCKQVMVTCQYEMSTRMIKNFFKEFGGLESCLPYGFGQYCIILTFNNHEVASKVVSAGSYNVGPTARVDTEFFKDALNKKIVDHLPSPTGTSLSLKFDFDSVSMIGERSEVGSFKTVREAEENEASLTDSFGTLNLQQSEGEECVTNSFSLELDTESHLYETVEIRQDSHEYLVAKPYESNSEPSNSLSMLSTNSVPTGPPPALPAPPAPPAPPPLPLLLPKLPKSRAEPQKLLYKPGVDLRDCIQINNCVVRLLLGDISEHPADILVNSSGMAGRAIQAKAAKGETKHLDMIKGEPFGNILVSSSTSIASNHVFSFRFNQSMGHDISFLQSHQSVIKLCLHHCDVLFARSVAFPALGTGLYGEAPSMMANMLVGAIIDYISTESLSTIEFIDIVIYEQSMIQDYSKALNRSAASSRVSDFRGILTKRRSGVENVYQVSKTSHRIKK